jgi:hypothetical protein
MPNAGVAPKFAPNLHEICTLATDLAQRERVAAPILNNRWKRTAMYDEMDRTIVVQLHPQPEI